MTALLPAIMTIEGMLGEDEAALLYERARATQHAIVEIGSYRGRSTVALALGSKSGYNVPVYAIDPHETNADGYPYSAQDRAALLANLVNAGVADTVRVIDLPADCVSINAPIGLLWIDGDHDAALYDFKRWAPSVVSGGTILLHDRHLEQVQAAADHESVERLPDVGGILQLRKR